MLLHVQDKHVIHTLNIYSMSLTFESSIMHCWCAHAAFSYRMDISTVLKAPAIVHCEPANAVFEKRQRYNSKTVLLQISISIAVSM